MSPNQHEIEIVRARLEARIQELVDMLDLLDGDPDLEDEADPEPALGWSAAEASYGRYGILCQAEEEEDDPAEPNGDEADTGFGEDER